MGDPRATFLVLSAQPVSDAARTALSASAEKLGHSCSPRFAALDETADLELFILEVDPWQVVAIDDGSVQALAQAFGAESQGLAPDHPVEARGYTLVAVPGFEACLGDQQAKRVAWSRLQSAKHPVAPW